MIKCNALLLSKGTVRQWHTPLPTTADGKKTIVKNNGLLSFNVVKWKRKFPLFISGKKVCV